MPPLKVKPIVRENKGMDLRGPNKTVDMNKFKIYSDQNRDSVAPNPSRTYLLSRKETSLANNTCLEDLACSTMEAKTKTKIARKALADVSNIQGNAFRLTKPGGSRNSALFGTATSSASSSRPLAGTKASLSRAVTVSRTSMKASNNKAMRNGSQVHDTVANVARGAARDDNAITRKSLPVLKRESHLAGSSLQGDGKSAENVTRKLGFQFSVKTRVGGHLVSQLSNPKRVPKDRKSDRLILRKSLPVLKRESHLGGSSLQGDGKSAENVTRKLRFQFSVKTRVSGHLVSQLSNPKRVPKDRKSDRLILRPPRYPTSKDALQRSGRSMKLPVRTALRNSNAQKNLNSKNISKSDKSLGTTLRRDTVASCSVVKTSSVGSQEVLEGRFESINDVKPHISEITANNRRTSYTSLLLVGNKTEVLEQKLPDIDDHGNPLEVAEYVDDIYQYYWIMEAESASLENYLMAQTDITPQMRGILVNWLIEVHLKFDLMPETLYLTIALLDRYLSLVPIKKKVFQLVGLASLLLASKYEDFWHPRVKDLISISAESYSRKQVLEMEKDILKRLKFRMNMPTPYVFMLRFLKASQSEMQVEHLTFYLIELSLVEYEALKFRHSILCASAIYVARCTLNKLPKWTPLLGKHAQYEESQIRECAQMILKFHKAASKSVLKVTYDKYTRPEFSFVATFKPLNSL